jgi:hypothetical protein
MPVARRRLLRASREPRETATDDEDASDRRSYERRSDCSTSVKKTSAHRACGWQRISDAMTFFRRLCAHCSRASESSAFLRLHFCVRRIRTATSFCHSSIYWTSWLQPWKGSV